MTTEQKLVRQQLSQGLSEQAIARNLGLLLSDVKKIAATVSPRKNGETRRTGYLRSKARRWSER